MLEVRHSMNAGEWSPRLIRRSDLAKYYAACKRLDNFVPQPMGGIHNRAGFEYLGDCKSDDNKCRLMRFSFSTSTNFILEMGDKYCRFWSNGLQVESGGSPLEVTTPYSWTDLDRVHYLQVKDVLYFVHPSHTPQKLTRVADDNWTWGAVTFDDWPVKDENVEDTTVTPSATTGTGIIIGSSDTVFNSAHVGARWRVSYRRDEDSTEVSEDITATGAGTSIQGRGEWTLKTVETWEATVEVEQSLDNGSTWEAIRVFKSESDRNFEITSTVDKTCLLRVNVTAWTSQTGGARAILSFDDPWVHGTAEIKTWVGTEDSPTAWADVTAYSVADQVDENSKTWVCIQAHTSAAANDQPDSGTNYLDYWIELGGDGYVTADVEVDLADTVATKYWAEGSWSDSAGFPGSITLHESRIYYGGTEDEPLTFWGSVVNDFESFILGTADDDAISFTIAASSDNRIAWLESYSNSLFIGTGGAEWLAQSRNDSEIISATNVSVEQQSRYGSAAIQPARLNDSLLFVQRVNRVVRDLQYSFERDNYGGNDISLLAEHMVRDGVTQVAFTQSPWSVLWCIAGNELVGLTYERAQDVVGWHRHPTNGTIESVATVPGNPNDEVWISVKRDINGTTKRFIERLEPNTEDKAWESDLDDVLYLDSGVMVNLGTPGTAVSGLDHLEGETVQVLTDGATHPDKTVSSGAITLDWDATKVMVGMSYTPVMETLPIVRPTDQGSSLARVGRLHRADLAVDKTLGLELSVFGHDAPDADWFRVYFRDQSMAMDTAPDVFTGIKDTTLDSRYSREMTLAIRQPDPLPLSLLSLTLEWDVSENP